jgi:hypothetical protein
MSGGKCCKSPKSPKSSKSSAVNSSKSLPEGVTILNSTWRDCVGSHSPSYVIMCVGLVSPLRSTRRNPCLRGSFCIPLLCVRIVLLVESNGYGIRRQVLYAQLVGILA